MLCMHLTLNIFYIYLIEWLSNLGVYDSGVGHDQLGVLLKLRARIDGVAL